MNKISGIPAVFAQLRAQASRLSAAAKNNETVKSKPSKKDRLPADNLPDAIVRALATVDKSWSFDDKVRRLVRAILAWEFGDEILDDPEFYRLLDKVVMDIRESETLTRDFALLFKESAGKGNVR